MWKISETLQKIYKSQIFDILLILVCLFTAKRLTPANAQKWQNGLVKIKAFCGLRASQILGEVVTLNLCFPWRTTATSLEFSIMIGSDKNLTFNKIEGHHFKKGVIYRPEQGIYRPSLSPDLKKQLATNLAQSHSLIMWVQWWWKKFTYMIKVYLQTYLENLSFGLWSISLVAR